MAKRKNSEEQILRLKEERDWLKARLREVRVGEPGPAKDDLAKPAPDGD